MTNGMRRRSVRPTTLTIVALAAVIGLGACGGDPGLPGESVGAGRPTEPESTGDEGIDVDDFAEQLDEAIDRGLGLTDVFGSADAGVDRDTSGESDEPVLGGGSFGDGMPSVLAAMAKAGAPTMVLDVTINPDVVVLTALDPMTSGQVLTWTWTLGTIEREGPHDPSLRYFADRPFPLDSVDWGSLPELIESAAASTAQDVDDITQVAVNRNTITGDEVVIRLLLPTPSADGSIDVSADGSIINTYL